MVGSTARTSMSSSISSSRMTAPGLAQAISAAASSSMFSSVTSSGGQKVARQRPVPQNSEMSDRTSARSAAVDGQG